MADWVGPTKQSLLSLVGLQPGWIFRFGAALLLCGASVFSYASLASHTYSANRVVAVGDIHGAYDSFVELLTNNGLLDDKLQWSAGESHFVSLGDLVDRGPDSRKVMDLLMRLQPEAEAAGGRVHVLLGNHEVMNLMGDLRNVSAEEYQAFASEPATPSAADAAPALGKPAGYLEHRAAFGRQGTYGRWLLTLPSLVRINDTAFVHGGLPPLVAELGLAQTNRQLTNTLGEQVAVESGEQPPPPILDELGPLWYRGTAGCHELIEAPILDAALQRLNAKRVVIGHTPTPNRQIVQRLDGRVIAIDTGMLNAVYKGRAFALEIDGTDIRTLAADGQRSTPIHFHSVIGTHPDFASELALSELMLQAPAVADEDSADGYILQGQDGRNYKAQFVRSSAKAAKSAQALWRLDRLLGINMVPMTLARNLGGRWGYLTFSSGRWLTETERQSRALARPNYCGGQHDYQIQAVFDMLTRGRLREGDSLSYRVGTWALRLTDQHKSFSTSTRLISLPQYPQVPTLLLARLKGLTTNSVQTAIGHLVSAKAIAALLVRRDKILTLDKESGG